MMNSRPLANSSPESRNLSRLKRSVVKNGSFILASTGERIHRQITLLNSSSLDRLPNVDSVTCDESWQRPQHDNSHLSSPQLALGNFKSRISHYSKWLKTSTGKGILKCSLAYLLGSMGTFLPPVANFLGRQDGKHVVATVMVYFHPARSAGSMLEAALLGFAAVFYATLVGFSSMAVSVLFETQLDMIEVAYVLILILFCGGGLGLVGWFKQSYNSPLVNVACSLASLAIISIITKEAAIQNGVFSSVKIIQVLKMVTVGITSSAFLSLLLWPVSARMELNEIVVKVTSSASDLLSIISTGFLTGSDNEMLAALSIEVQENQKLLFTQLTKCLRESKFEHYVLGTETAYKHESNLVNCFERLSQSIGGLRSAAATQFTLLKESSGSGTSTPTNISKDLPEYFANSSIPHAVVGNIEPSILRSIGNVFHKHDDDVDDDQKDCSLFKPKSERSISMLSTDTGYFLTTVRTPSEIFSRFILLLGPSIKSLVFTLSQILRDFPIQEQPDIAILKIEQYKMSLGSALKLYANARSQALRKLYEGKGLDRQRPQSVEADFEEVAASCGYFSFSLQTFANEMLTFMEIVGEMKEEKQNPHRSWKWLRFWRRSRNSKQPTEEEEGLLAQKIPETHISRRIPDLVLRNLKTRRQESEQSIPDFKKKIVHQLISLMKFLNRDDIRFAVKVGIGASLYASFAYIPATRPFYKHWRGEWGLLSYMLVCSMTIGASNKTGYSRFIGTFIGASIAISVWIICQGNAFALAFSGWLISLPCFYLIIAKDNAAFGRFIMLTYNLSCLYAYSLSIKNDDDNFDEDEGGIAPIISEIALHRLIAVFVGVIWGMIITRIIWPISARKKLQDGLSLLWLRMGLIWKRDPLADVLEGDSPVPYMNLKEEFALHRYLLRLENLQKSAINEFELRGQFPIIEFRKIMDSTVKMLDSFHAMNDIIQSDIVVSEGEKVLLQYTASERAHLCLIISHLYQVLASSLKLEYPINDPLPSISKARDCLLAKVFQFRKESTDAETKGKILVRDEDYQILYAYILVTGQLAEEIGRVETEVIKLYGVMNEDVLRLK